jgi:hypothetical protein
MGFIEAATELLNDTETMLRVVLEAGELREVQ